jgi:DNA-binding MarR family transcriptional regulator
MTESHANALTETILAIFEVNGLLLAWGDRFAAPHGLTSARWQMLVAIGHAGAPLTAPAIAAAMGMTRQGAQKQLDLLLEDGLVESIPNPAHARSPLYQHTRAGRTLHDRLDRKWRERARLMAAAVAPGDLPATRRFLTALQGQLAKDIA